MNLRNLAIFGVTRKTKVIIVSVLVLAAVVALSLTGVIKTKPEITSQITKDVIQETQQQASTNETPPNTTTESQQIPPPESKEKLFTEYPGQCAVEIKRAEDDVADVESYISEDQKKYDSLKAEFDEKIKKLQDEIDRITFEYKTPLKLSQDEIDKAKEELEYTKKRLEELRGVCEIK